MSEIPEIYVDWNDNFGSNFIALSCQGSLEDIRRQNIEMTDGLKIMVYGDGLSAQAEIRYLHSENVWVAEVGNIERIDRSKDQP